jgi:hypothetical protein
MAYIFLSSVETCVAFLSFLELAAVYILSVLHRRRMTYGRKTAKAVVSKEDETWTYWVQCAHQVCRGFYSVDQIGWRITSDRRAKLLNVALEIPDELLFRQVLSDAFIFDALCTEGAGEKNFAETILGTTMHGTDVWLVNSTEEQRQYQLIWDA